MMKWKKNVFSLQDPNKEIFILRRKNKLNVVNYAKSTFLPNERKIRKNRAKMLKLSVSMGTEKPNRKQG